MEPVFGFSRRDHVGSPEKINPQAQQGAARDADKNQAARTDNADHLAQGRNRMWKMLQHMPGHDHIETVVGVGKALSVGLAQCHIEADFS